MWNQFAENSNYSKCKTAQTLSDINSMEAAEGAMVTL